MPILSTAPGRKFWTTTSAVAIIRLRTSTPRGSFRLRTIERLLRLATAKVGDMPRLRPTHRAGEVADAGRFDFDDVGALVGEDHRRHRTGDHLGEVDYADAVERSGHRGGPPVGG